MGSDEDAALLVLIHQHLKVSGYREAAQLLEEHLTQVEMPVESLNLHDIYTGWMKLCSLAQHAKQETEIDSGTLKTKVIKQEEEEAADVKLYSVAGDNKADDKPLSVSKMEVVASSTAETTTGTVSDQNLDPADKTQTGRSDGGASKSSDSEVEEEWKKTSTDTKTVPTEASVVASNEGKSSISASSDTERTSEPTQGNSDPINPSQPETQLRTSDPAEVSGSESEQEEENEEEQEPQAVINSPEVTKETCASEPIDAVQVATVCSSQETNVAELLEEEQLTAAERSVHAESVSDPTVEDTSNQAAEREAPPPADADSEIPQVVRFETEEEDELKTPVATEDQSDASDPPARAAEVQEDDDSCIILNIQTNEAAKQQPAELFGDPITARKKKKSKKGSAETSWVDIAVTPSTDVAYTDTLSDSPLTSRSKKKKRKGKKRDEMANEEKNKNKVSEESQVAKPKKKAKKRKREDMEETIFPLENTSKKKKKKQQLTDGMKHKTEMTGMDEGNSGNSAETRLRKNKKKREELQFKEAPAEGEKEQTKATADSNSSQLSSAKKKKHLRRKLSLKKRLKLRKKEMMRKAQSPNFHAGQTITGRKKQKQEQKETGKSPRPKTEINTEQEESSWKENQPPRRRKRRKSVMNILDAPEDESEFSKEKKEKKKKTKMGEISPPDMVTQLPPAKKKKKDRLKIQLEDTEAPPAVSEAKNFFPNVIYFQTACMFAQSEPFFTEFIL
ncbi:neurofilament heavy polypeptide-like isoform X2 [Girardinichthys multiradiatus]|uniref:neurofilament heavy polypeptide-like isoform X2 n=1 Tax=Girardinichthys multiradiatus TaxID=208333 RepID=UPI001FAD0B1D|nr:neurofilament heavy polypeptide-like isoform X2 [Girardinichthys multiradiatus]